jgi:hypothetical protein
VGAVGRATACLCGGGAHPTRSVRSTGQISTKPGGRG